MPGAKTPAARRSSTARSKRWPMKPPKRVPSGPATEPTRAPISLPAIATSALPPGVARCRGGRGGRRRPGQQRAELVLQGLAGGEADVEEPGRVAARLGFEVGEPLELRRDDHQLVAVFFIEE